LGKLECVTKRHWVKSQLKDTEYLTVHQMICIQCLIYISIVGDSPTYFSNKEPEAQEIK
jgi:hypothetical protein